LTDNTVEEIRNLAVPEFRYRDPFMDAHGIDAVVYHLHKWFQDMSDIKFIMEEYAVDNLILFQHWKMNFRLRGLPKRLWELDGVSRITFNEEGKVVDQIDYWDAAPLFEYVPVLGAAVKLIRKFMA
jgi:steroid delta-isomerase